MSIPKKKKRCGEDNAWDRAHAPWGSVLLQSFPIFVIEVDIGAGICGAAGALQRVLGNA